MTTLIEIIALNMLRGGMVAQGMLLDPALMGGISGKGVHDAAHNPGGYAGEGKTE